jgi:hypothetical protein
LSLVGVTSLSKYHKKIIILRESFSFQSNLSPINKKKYLDRDPLAPLVESHP